MIMIIVNTLKTLWTPTNGFAFIPPKDAVISTHNSIFYCILGIIKYSKIRPIMTIQTTLVKALQADTPDEVA